MCGIACYVGPRDAAPIVLDGLRRLEYRGYDSAGIVTFEDGAAHALKRAGKLAVLSDAATDHPLPGRRALGHTRWATHGPPTDANAHPHATEDGRIALVHNGIIENHAALRAELEAAGHRFASDTDSETVAHLIESLDDGDLHAAVRAATARLEGAWALVVAHADRPELVVARRTSPLVIGLGDGERFVASDVAALLPYTKCVVYLRDGETAVVGPDAVTVFDDAGHPTDLREEAIPWEADAAEKGGWPHFMLKEIFEQPTVVRNVLQDALLPGGGIDLGLRVDLASVDRVVVVAAGTAAYAGRLGAAWIERFARIPAHVEVASEFRYRDPVVGPDTLVVAVSQSGETIDTLEALREAGRAGARRAAFVNVRGSSIAREVDDVALLRAGPEIGVASTKAYLAMATRFVLLALQMGHARGVLDDAAVADWTTELRALPSRLEEALARRDAVRAAAADLDGARSVLYLGRGTNVASAYEGALKLKEISYLHAEAYPTGEMKHGPIALIDATVPVVALAPEGPLHAKTRSNLQEVRARDGRVLALASDGDATIDGHADRVLWTPRVPDALSPLLLAIPMQLLAYETAVRLGRDVDQPRNLAKSVTVE
ncbi:MAG: glutamine--fructose-6-phosphate transaminase (isomerizing) [Trueperaceae bacterium]|nr:glutamine--fructose-6-phosphate transaminase (isomerizing) [Trueperaceae bacterium]